ncbi:MAG: ATP-binding protein [Acidobacteriota bacterium]
MSPITYFTKTGLGAFAGPPFDVKSMPSAALADLDLRFFDEAYLPKAFAPEILEANDRSLEQRLAATKMVVAAADPTPTVLGVLVLGKKPRDFLPGAYIQFLRVAGKEFGDPVVDDQVIDGRVDKILHRIDDKLRAHNRTAVDFTSGTVERRISLYPLVALQQLVRNAVLHRAYESTHAPARVYWFDDRIEIINPGGPYGAVTHESFGEPGVVDYRNPNLAEALRVLGFVQRYGAGLMIARRELAENGNPALEFNVQQTIVAATIRPSSTYLSYVADI